MLIIKFCFHPPGADAHLLSREWRHKASPRMKPQVLHRPKKILLAQGSDVR